jgi:hypothetical protein
MTEEECRNELALSVRSTRRLLHKFRRDDRRDELDSLLDRAYSRTDREDISVNDYIELMNALVALRRAMNGAMNGEAAPWRDIEVSKTNIRKILDMPGRIRVGSAFCRLHGNAKSAFSV